MQNWLAKLTSGLAVVAVFASSASAAMVTDIQGDVLINRGVGFVAVKEPVEVAPGDLVLVRADGSARLDFGPGCGIAVKPGQIVRVSAKPTCQQAQGKGGNSDTTTTTGGSIPTSTLVIGGLAVAGGAGFAIGLAGGGGGSGDSSSRPASP
jgi:hypothetical protein